MVQTKCFVPLYRCILTAIPNTQEAEELEEREAFAWDYALDVCGGNDNHYDICNQLQIGRSIHKHNMNVKKLRKKFSI